MPFLDLLTPGRVRTDIVATDKADLISELATLLADGHDDADDVRDALLAREKLGSTGLGLGVAIPHGRSPAITRARAAFVRLATPIDFKSADQQPVDLVAALIVPAQFTDQHLQLLAELAELFSNSDITDSLRAARGDDGLHTALRKGLRAAG